MKSILVILALAGSALAAYADEGDKRTFEITVREILPNGQIASVGGPAIITVRCGKPDAIHMVRESTYPTDPPQTGPGVVFTGQIETSGCKP